MITTLRSMMTCLWAARRLQRYLDSDPAAALDQAEVRRLQAHLEVCARCGRRSDEYRALSRALGQWSARRRPEPQLVSRTRETAERLINEEPT